MWWISIIPGRALFFLDIGADLGKEGEGDLSRICPRLFVLIGCKWTGEVMPTLECTVELQMVQSKLQIGE